MKQMIRNKRKHALPILACLLAATFHLAAEEPATDGGSAKKQAGAEASLNTELGWAGLAPTQMVAAIEFDGLPLRNITQALRDQFKGNIDIIMPASATTADGWVPNDAGNVQIHLSLRNVKAGEIFEAMNQLFSAEGTPL